MGSLAPKKATPKKAKFPSAQDIRQAIEDLEGQYGVARRLARFEPMDELISCILSQHASDKSSFPAFTQLKATFPEWQDVVDAGQEAVAETIKNAGLANQKSKSIIGCLRAIYEKTGNYSLDLLWDMDTLTARSWLLELPGVGPKTASIVLCFSFGRETIPVDTHVFRVANRLGYLPEGANENKAHDILLHLVPHDLAFRFHATLIQHGRHLCRAPIPQCEPCVLRDRCPWFAAESRSKPQKVSRGLNNHR